MTDRGTWMNSTWGCEVDLSGSEQGRVLSSYAYGKEGVGFIKARGTSWPAQRPLMSFLRGPLLNEVCYWKHLMFVDPCIIVQFTKKNPTRCNNVSKFYYYIFIWSSTCFGRHTAHHQESKTALAASGFSYVEGFWPCSWWTLSGTQCLTTSTNYTSNTVPDNVHQLHVQQPSTYEKPEAASAVLGSWWWAVCRPKHAELHINM